MDDLAQWLLVKLLVLCRCRTAFFRESDSLRCLKFPHRAHQVVNLADRHITGVEMIGQQVDLKESRALPANPGVGSVSAASDKICNSTIWTKKKNEHG